LYYLDSYLFFTMHSTVCTVIDLFMCVCHILLINYYYYIGVDRVIQKQLQE